MGMVFPKALVPLTEDALRYLHKLFESQDETVAARIRRRRLECCKRDLADPALQSTAVSAIAARWGLTDPTQFSRQFRMQYGIAPSDYRRVNARPR
jgi:AraC-like DNA-binding protein